MYQCECHVSNILKHCVLHTVFLQLCIPLFGTYPLFKCSLFAFFPSLCKWNTAIQQRARAFLQGIVMFCPNLFFHMISGGHFPFTFPQNSAISVFLSSLAVAFILKSIAIWREANEELSRCLQVRRLNIVRYQFSLNCYINLMQSQQVRILAGSFYRN